MLTMTDYHRRRCLQALEKVEEYKISSFFSRPVDPVRDNCLNYFEIIEHPMDLGTVRKKLLSNEYQNPEEFKKDVNLIWDNSFKYNGKDQIISNLAKQLKKVFADNTQYLTGNEIVDWCLETDAIKSSIGIFDAIPQQEPKSYSLRQRKSDTNYAAEQPLPTKSSSRSTRRSGLIERGVSQPVKALVSEPVAEPVQEVVVEEEQKTPAEPEQTKPRGYTDEEKRRIADEVSNLQSDVVIDKIFAYIKEIQPEVVQNDSIDTDITNLREETLQGIKAILDESDI